MTLLLVFNFEDREDRCIRFKKTLFPSTEYRVEFYGKEVDENCFRQPRKEWCKSKNLSENEPCCVFAHASQLIVRNSKKNEYDLVKDMVTWDPSWTHECSLILYHGGNPLNVLKNAIKKAELTTKQGLKIALLEQAIEYQKPEFLQKLCALAAKKDWKAFLNCTPASDSGPEQPYLERLTALDILLQGYLAIFNKEDFFNQGDPQKTKEFLEHHGILQGHRETEAKKLIANDCLFRNKTIDGVYGQNKSDVNVPKEDGYFWFDECLSKPIPDKSDINNLKKVGGVWDLMNGFYNGNISYLPAQATLAGLFQEAHDEYVFFFEKKNTEKKLKDLESKRWLLNHNQIKNSFLLPLSDGDASTDLKNRSRVLFSAWEGFSNSDSTKSEQVSRASSRSVAQAMTTWPSIRQTIFDFFEKDIPEAGFCLSEKGEQLYGQIFGDKGWIEEIGRFVSDFESLAKQDEEQKTARLDRFYQAIDDLHNGISNMRHKEGAKDFFGGNLKDSAL